MKRCAVDKIGLILSVIFLVVIFSNGYAAADDWANDTAVLPSNQVTRRAFQTANDIGEHIIELIRGRDVTKLKSSLNIGDKAFVVRMMKFIIKENDYDNIKSWEVNFSPVQGQGTPCLVASIVGRYTATMTSYADLIITFENHEQTRSVITNTKRESLDILNKDFSRILSPEQQRSDLTHFISTLEESHPNLYAFIEKEVFMESFDRVMEHCGESRPVKEFSRLVNELGASFKEGHTGGAFHREFFTYAAFGGIFPFAVERAGDSMIITGNFSEADIPAGTRIVDINSVAVSRMLADLEKYQGFERAEMFNMMVARYFGYYLWYGFDIVEPFIMTLELPTGEVVKVAVSGGLEEVMNQVLSGTKAKNDYEFHVDEVHRVGILDFYSCNDLGSFETLMQAALKEMKEKNIKDFIVDIRDNSGGNSKLCDYLFECVCARPYTTYLRVETKISNLAKMTYDWYEDDEKGALLVSDFKPENPGIVENRFSGNVYTLVGPYTFSSAADLAALFKDNSVGILVGEETGGLATSYGDTLRFRLPESHVPVRVSYKRFVRPNGKDTGRGVIPHIKVNSTVTGGIDPAKDRVLGLIKRSRR